MWRIIKRLLCEHLGYAEILEKTKVPGGDIYQAWYLRFGDTEVFVKYNTYEMLPFFSVEAEQLALLASTHTIQVPKVYAVGSSREHSFLLLEYQLPKPFDPHNAYCLGQQLAHLHQWSEQLQFGLDFDNDLATTPQPNKWQNHWAQFFAEQRIGWQLQLAKEKGVTLGDIDQIISQTHEKLQHHQPQPSLLHGNLWPANCAAIHSGPITFNPACYWGDRECDLAMLPLYPTLPVQIYDGYQSVWPLPAGFLARQPLYQLYYLLNRSILFGDQHIITAQKAVNQFFNLSS